MVICLCDERRMTHAMVSGSAVSRPSYSNSYLFLDLCLFLPQCEYLFCFRPITFPVDSTTKSSISDLDDAI